MTAVIATGNQSCYGNGMKINVEVEITKGIGIHLVGLKDTETRDCLLRVATALQKLGYGIPGKKIEINVRPSNARVNYPEGYDLPVAIGLLIASGQINVSDKIDLATCSFYGMLDTDGGIRDYSHCGHAVASAAAMRFTGTGVRPILVTGEATAMQACSRLDVKTMSFEYLSDVIAYLEGRKDGVKELVWNTDAFKRLVGYANQAVWLEKVDARLENEKKTLPNPEK